MSLVDPTRPDARVTTRRTRGTVIVSLALHVVVLAAVVVVPLIGEVTLPGAIDHSVPSFVRAVVAPPAPAPPATASRTSARAADTTARRTDAPTSAPLEAPDQLPAAEAPTYIPGMSRAFNGAGVPIGGVDGGLPGSPVTGTPPPPPPPPAPVRTPMRVGGDIRPPRKLHHVAPVYPGIAAHARITGTVVVEATISRSGVVSDVRVLRSVPLLDAAATEAVRQWRYEPPQLNGEPVAVLLTVTVHFGH